MYGLDYNVVESMQLYGCSFSSRSIPLLIQSKYIATEFIFNWTFSIFICIMYFSCGCCPAHLQIMIAKGPCGEFGVFFLRIYYFVSDHSPSLLTATVLLSMDINVILFSDSPAVVTLVVRLDVYVVYSCTGGNLLQPVGGGTNN